MFLYSTGRLAVFKEPIDNVMKEPVETKLLSTVHKRTFHTIKTIAMFMKHKIRYIHKHIDIYI